MRRFHCTNLQTSDEVCKISLIDFGSTVVDANIGKLTNLYCFLEGISEFKASSILLPALRQVGVPIPRSFTNDDILAEVDDFAGLRTRELERIPGKVLAERFRQTFPVPRFRGGSSRT